MPMFRLTQALGAVWLLVLAAAMLLLAGCGGSTSSSGGGDGPTSDTYIGDLTTSASGDVAPHYKLQLDLTQDGDALSGTAIIFDTAAPDDIRSVPFTGTSGAGVVDARFTAGTFGEFTLDLTRTGDRLVGTFRRVSGELDQDGSTSLVRASAKTIAAIGVWSGTALVPGAGAADAATMNVSTQSNAIASGFVSTRGLTIPFGFLAVEGTTTYSVPGGLGSITTTIVAAGDSFHLTGNLKINENAKGIPAGTYRLDLTKQSSVATAQMPGIWVGGMTPAGGSQQTLQFQFDQTGTVVSGAAFLYTGSLITTGTITGIVTGDKVSLSVQYANPTVGTVTYTGDVTAGNAYTGSFAGVSNGAFTMVKTTAQILNLKGNWTGKAVAGSTTVDVTLNLDNQVGAMASGTLTLKLPTNPSGQIVIYAVAGVQTGGNATFTYSLTVSATKITGTVKILSTNTTFDVTVNKA